WALDPKLFGRHPNGTHLEAASLCVQAPSVVEIRLPSDFVAGCEFVTTGLLDSKTGAEGSVQLQVQTTRPNLRGITPHVPFVVADGSESRRRLESVFDDFRRLFPAALCYTKIVPVDEPVTL